MPISTSLSTHGRTPFGISSQGSLFPPNGGSGMLGMSTTYPWPARSSRFRGRVLCLLASGVSGPRTTRPP